MLVGTEVLKCFSVIALSAEGHNPAFQWTTDGPSNEPNTFPPDTGEHPVTPDAQGTLTHGHTSADADASAATAPHHFDH